MTKDALIRISKIPEYFILLTLSLIPKCIAESSKKTRNIMFGKFIQSVKKTVIIERYIIINKTL